MMPALLVALLLASKTPVGMAAVPAGSYQRLFAATSSSRTHVAAFAIDREPVTRGEFLGFVRAHPSWRRSGLDSALAEREYLSDWRGDLDAGDTYARRTPVRNVSWFAARAYCQAQGKRLPTTDEWEYVAAADETRRDATHDPAFIQRLLTISTTHVGGFRNVYGVAGLHGKQWEWTDDFSGAGAPDDSRPMASSVHTGRHDLSCAGSAMGAPDPSNYPAFLRSAVRAALTRRSTTSHVGFRCAM
jgi:sulfatase modifying factor 1